MDHPFRNLGPVLYLSVAVLAGFFLGLLSGPCLAAAGGAFLFLAILLLALRMSPLASGLAVAAFCGLLAAGRMPFADPDTVGPFLEGEVILTGHAVQVRRTDSGWSGIVERATVTRADGAGTIRFRRILLTVWNPDADVSFPAGIRATGRLRQIRSRGNPGEIPREWTALASGVQYRFAADASRCVFLPRGQEDVEGAAIFRRARDKTDRWIARQAGDSDGALFLRAVTTGIRPPPSHSMVTLLRRTGLGHLLAISGVHVVLFFSVQCGIVRFALWIFRRRRGSPDLNGISAFLSLPASWGYVFLAGSPISAVRAAGMLTAAVLLRRALRVRGAGAAWAFLFLFSLADSPARILSPSFLLSYGASFFLIVAYAGRKRDVSRPVLPFRLMMERAKDAAVGSATVFLGTLPVSAAFFGHLPAGAIVWNILFVPLLGTAGVAGTLIGVTGGVFSLDVLGRAFRVAERILGMLLAALAAVSGDGAWWFPLPPTGIAAPFAGAVASAIGSLWLRARGRAPWPAAALGCAVFLAWIHVPYLALPDYRLTVAALNVGKGACHVVSFPGGGNMVVDCGSGLYGDAGRSVLVPFLRSRGIRGIDVLVLTHPHEDHYGGANALLEEVPVREIWIPEGIPPAAFGEAVRKRSGAVRWKSPGDKITRGGAEAVVRGTGRTGIPRDINEQSLMLEIRFGAFSAWLPGDVEGGPSSWGAGSRGGADVVRVLFLPHHGSPGARPGEWIGAASPAVTVAQNSDCFKKGNLVPSGQSFFLENGAVTMRSDGKSVILEQRGRPGIWGLLLRLRAGEGTARRTIGMPRNVKWRSSGS